MITAAEPEFRLPESLACLGRLALNVRWSWNARVLELFHDLDPELWDKKTGPVALLRRSERLSRASRDPRFVRRCHEQAAELNEYLGQPPQSTPRVAYFCAEYGFHETIPLYCGGLGILAGDHCKEASDQKFPMIAVGILYRRGFFTQRLDWEGRQEHEYPVVDPLDLPVSRVLDPATGRPLTVQVPVPGREVAVAVWLMRVGVTPLLLLDTDTPPNSQEDCCITSQLYMRGREMRFYQETILGVGGIRALRALGITPTVYHMNEGHSALLLLELLAEECRAGSSFEQARAKVKSQSVLTIHTPVPEGNERFDHGLVDPFLSALLPGTGLVSAQLLALGQDSKKSPDVFDMTAFALRHSRLQNGVSRLHGHTADKTWRRIAGQPLMGLTNGVHLPTWLGPDLKGALESVGCLFEPTTAHPGLKSALKKLDRQLLWRSHCNQKERMIRFVRQRLFDQMARSGSGPSELGQCMNALDPSVFTIGFSRRFAPYKRADLVFADPKRLSRILADKRRPVQIVFAGKAHPGDREGQALIAKVFRLSHSWRFGGRVFLVEDYNMEVGRMLVQGVDLWLNNPRRPLEASGTSGMKAAVNGVPNLSVLDGWWDEAHSGANGWAIGDRKTIADVKAQDAKDAASLYRLLETEVVPLFYERDSSGFPSAWAEVMVASIEASMWQFSTARMLSEYNEQMYDVGGTGASR